jgi:vitamin K-dependent gamma-carboxylase
MRTRTGESSRIGALQSELSRQVSPASLAVFRIGFGAIMVWHLAKLLWPHAWGTKLAFQYLDPAWLCPYIGFEWIRAWPEPFLTLHVWIVLLAAVGVALGCYYRICTTVFCVGYTYLFLLESADYNNHYYLICLIAFLLIWMPANQFCSVDAWRQRRAKSPKDADSSAATIPFWPVFLLRSQFFVVYFFGGIAKFNADWLTGIPLLAPSARLHGSLAATGWLPSFIDVPEVALFLAWGGLVFDLLIGFLLLFPRTRLVGIVAMFVFHFTNNLLFSIGIFPVMAFTSSLIFFPSNWPLQAARWLRRPRWNLRMLLGMQPRQPSEASQQEKTKLLKPVVQFFVVGWLTIQVLIPLRHYLIPGDANWSEEGQRFSWRMMLRMKAPGHMIYYVNDKKIQVRRNNRAEIDWDNWPFEGSGAMHVPIISSQFSWAQHSGLTIIFEPCLGRRIIFGVKTEPEEAAEMIRRHWRLTYGRVPDSIHTTVDLPTAVAAIRRSVPADEDQTHRLLDEVERLARLKTGLIWDESRRQLELTNAVELLLRSDSPSVEPLRRIHPFALQGAAAPGRQLLIVDDQQLTRGDRSVELRRLSDGSAFLVWLDLEQMRPRDWRRLPQQFVVYERGKLGIIWNHFRDLNWQQTERMANRPHATWLYAQHIADRWKDATDRISASLPRSCFPPIGLMSR